jgi:hypothetical protein
MFGTSANNIGRDFGWATRSVLAVSRAPLTALSLFVLVLFGFSLVLNGDTPRRSPEQISLVVIGRRYQCAAHG